MRLSDINVAAIIPARGGSKGIPKKNLLKIIEHTLVAWSIMHAKKSVMVNDIFVSTDDQEIANEATKYGAETIWRPDKLASDTASTESVLLHALPYMVKEDKAIDLVVCLQPTSPVREGKDIDNAIALMAFEHADSCFSAKRIEGFVWSNLLSENSWLPEHYALCDRPRRQDLTSEWVEENGSFYIFKPEILIDKRCRLGGKIIPFIQPGYKAQQIDADGNGVLCEQYMRSPKLYPALDYLLEI